MQSPATSIKSPVRPTRTGLSRLFHPRRRHRLLPTVEGVGFIILMQLVGFAAWHSGTNLIYLIFAMLIAFFLAHGVIVSIMVRGVEATRHLPPHIHALEQINIPVEITNTRRLWTIYALRIIDFLPKGRAFGAGYVARALPRTTVNTGCTAVFPRRGHFRLNHLEVRSRFPFGLIERAAVFSQPDDVIVYPALADVRTILGGATGEAGDVESRTKGQGVSLFGLREYTGTEPARHIHWRSTAKAGELMVKEFEKEDRRRVSIIFANHCPEVAAASPRTAELFERAVILAASLARQLVSTGYEVELLTDSGIVPPGDGEPHLHRIYRALAILEMTSQVTLPPRIGENGNEICRIVFHGPALPRRQDETVFDVRELEIRAGRFAGKAA
ncbi:MAG: DUF58 domain-containing protein [Candidatus Sumerlaeaceae bacterium]|nr:DUF58 domain-containing protein [Candidatus Sumerlaeaceae bacterium]